MYLQSYKLVCIVLGKTNFAEICQMGKYIKNKKNNKNKNK